MKIIKYTQGSEEWIEYRRTGIGSSDIACIMGCGFGSKADLFYEKSGFKSKFVNDAMRRGNQYEEEARRFIENRTGLSYDPICVEHDEISYFRASLDGYNEFDNSIIEIKVPSDPKAFKAAQDGMIPDKYQVQMQWQLLVSEARVVYFCVYDTIIKDVAIVEVYPDLYLQEKLIAAGHKFWDEYERGILDEDEEELIEIKGEGLDLLEEEYREAYLAYKMAEERLASLKTKIYDLGDDGNFRFGKVRCTKVKGKQSYDIDKMKKDGLNIDKYRKFSPHYYKITLDK